MANRYTVAGTVAGVILGGAALLNVGTSTGTVAAGDDPRIVGAIQASTLTANGDLLVRAAGVPAPLPVGTEGQVLTVTSGAPAWAAAAGGSTARSGTFAAIGTASSYGGGVYRVTSGVGINDVYISDGSAWRIVRYDLLGVQAPTMRWRLNETSGTTAANSGSATSADWTITGSPTLNVPLGAGGARGIAFNATSKYASGYGTTPSSTTAFSTCVTFSLFSTTGSFQPLLIRRLASPGEPYSWYVGVLNGVLVMYFRDAAQGSYSTLTGTGFPVSLGVRHHVAAALASGTLRLYLDGMQVASVAVTGGILWASTGSPVWATGYTGSATEHTSGLVAEVQVYDGTGLTAAEVATLAERALGSYGGQ